MAELDTLEELHNDIVTLKRVPEFISLWKRVTILRDELLNERKSWDEKPEAKSQLEWACLASRIDQMNKILSVPENVRRELNTRLNPRQPIRSTGG